MIKRGINTRRHREKDADAPIQTHKTICLVFFATGRECCKHTRVQAARKHAVSSEIKRQQGKLGAEKIAAQQSCRFLMVSAHTSTCGRQVLISCGIWAKGTWIFSASILYVWGNNEQKRNYIFRYKKIWQTGRFFFFCVAQHFRSLILRTFSGVVK